MRKIALLFALIICTSINVYAGGFKFNLKSCERYGTEVMITFAVENTSGRDYNIKLMKKWCIVLDAEGNKYPTSEFTYGTLCEGKSLNNDSFVFGLQEDIHAPKGKNEIYEMAAPDGVNLLVRVTAYDVPYTLKMFDCIQIRGSLSADQGFCINWKQANITDVK